MYPAIPREYEQYLESQGLFEGFTTGNTHYVVLWPLERIPGYNADLSVVEYAPGFVAFAGNGGGEVFAFDAEGAVFQLPMIGMEGQYAIPVAPSFKEFADQFIPYPDA